MPGLSVYAADFSHLKFTCIRTVQLVNISGYTSEWEGFWQSELWTVFEGSCTAQSLRPNFHVETAAKDKEFKTDKGESGAEVVIYRNWTISWRMASLWLGSIFPFLVVCKLVFHQIAMVIQAVTKSVSLKTRTISRQLQDNNIFPSFPGCSAGVGTTTMWGVSCK